MQEEYTTLINNNTWSLVPPTQASNIIGCKWDVTISKLKTRLVAKDFTQRLGIDYIDTLRPIIKPTTLKILLSLVVSNHWPLRQLNINNAFLQGTLTNTIYMA